MTRRLAAAVAALLAFSTILPAQSQQITFTDYNCSHSSGDGVFSVSMQFPDGGISARKLVSSMMCGLLPAGLDAAVTAKAAVNAENHYQESYVGKVLFQGHGFLSYSKWFETSYTESVHSCEGEEVVTFDLGEGRRIDLKYLFRSDFEEHVTPLLLEHLPISQDDVLSPESLVPTGNFYLDSKGVTWVYDPYEISFYSNGIIRVTVPWEELKPVLHSAVIARMKLQ